MFEKPGPFVQLSLSRDAALVLFEMIASQSDASEIVVRDPAEHTAIWKLEGALDEVLVEPLQPNYANLVEEAKARLQK